MAIVLTRRRGRGGLGKAGEGRGADCNIIQPAVDKDHGHGALEFAGGPACGEAAHDPQDDCEADGAVESERTSTDDVDQKPAHYVAEH